MELVHSHILLKKPHWAPRNKMIANEFLDPFKSVLDLGCGAKNLLKFYHPQEYLGLDGYDIPEVDMVVDLDTEFQHNIKSGWDYCVNSGVLEYVENFRALLKRQKELAKEYIFTWDRMPGWGRLPFEEVEKIISEDYEIIKKKNWGKNQRVWKCRPI